MPRHGTSVKNEVNNILKESGFLRIGGEKADEKTKTDYHDEAKAAGLKTSHEMAGVTPFTKKETLERYKETYRDFGRFGRLHGYGHDIKKYPPQVVTEYLTGKISAGAAWETVKVDCSALNKLDNVLNACDGGTRDWSTEISEMKKIAKETCPHNDGAIPRRFTNPQAVIDNLSGKAKLIAELQLHYGLRVRDASTIRLNDDNSLSIVSKNGFRVPHFAINSQHATQLRELAQGRVVFTLMPYKEYLSELKAACLKVGEHNSFSHAFRHNFACNLYQSELSKGKSEASAKATVSEALFHHRMEIVNRYIR